MLASALERPVLAHPHRLRELAVTLDVPAAGVDDVIPHLCLDPNHDSVQIVGAALTAQDADVLDFGRADGLDGVAPALALEVIEASLPLDQQLRCDQPAQGNAIVGRPGALDVREQLCGRLPHCCGAEDRILVLGLGGSQLDAALAFAALAPVRATLLCVRSPERQEAWDAAFRDPPGGEQRDQHEQEGAVRRDRQDDDFAEDEEDEKRLPAAATTAAATATAEARGAAAGGGRYGDEDEQRQRDEH